MRLLFVIQRYGEEVAGGAESACRSLATRLAARDHDVEVLTSRAQSYVDWADTYPAGTSSLDGVTVHRLGVSGPRQDRYFSAINGRTVYKAPPTPLFLQAQWMRTQGPLLPELAPWLETRGRSYDAVVFVTYLYYTTWAGLPAVAGTVPTVLMPTAHDEPPIYLPLFDHTFRLPTAFAFLTDEERMLVGRRFRIRRPNAVAGLGIDLETVGDEHAFRSAFGLGDRPYLLYVGRLDPMKGSVELYHFFTAYKGRHPGPLALAVVGEPVSPLDPHPDVVCTGFVDEATKAGALAGCTALVQPSSFESFSLVLAEAWAQGRPALVQAGSEVLRGQARRSCGAIPYQGFAEFEAAVDLLFDEPGTAAWLGERGQEYVRERYGWDTVLDRYEQLFDTARTLFHRSVPRVATVALATAAARTP